MKNSVNKHITSSTLIGVYPGTFDPVTLGHIDIIERAIKVVDHLVIGVADNPEKAPLFTMKQRTTMLKTDIANNKKLKDKSIEVLSFSKLLMRFVEDMNARVIIRGLRALSDFEYEFQMTGMNYYLNEDIETVFLMAQDKHQFISSRLVREIGRLGGDISHFVTPNVVKEMKKKFKGHL